MKKVFTIGLVLVFFLFIFCSPLAQPSSAFAASAVLIGAVIAVMAVSGLALVATAGLTANDLKVYIGDKLDEWAAAQGDVVNHLINTAGIGMTISGLLQIVRTMELLLFCVGLAFETRKIIRS